MGAREQRVTTRELCELAGVTRSTLQRWQALGLIDAPVRTGDGNGNRAYYPPAMLQRVRWIQRERAKGKSLEELAESLR